MKEIEKRDSVLTPKQQIDRLLRPGSTYFNLNPFEVLQIDPETSLEEAKKKYKRLSILVHPDKNQDDAERAQAAFESKFIYRENFIVTKQNAFYSHSTHLLQLLIRHGKRWKHKKQDRNA